MGLSESIDNYFEITARGSTVYKELRAAFALFGACSYILLVNPKVLSLAGIDERQGLAGTAITGALWTFLLGVFVNVPLIVGPGMGLNVFFACEMIRVQGMSYNNACGVCLVSFLLMFLLTASGMAVKFIRSMPNCLKQAVVIGIGLLQSFLGLYSLGIIESGETTPLMFKSVSEPSQIVALITLLITTILMSRNVDGAMVYGMAIGVMIWYLVVADDSEEPQYRNRLPEVPSQHFDMVEFNMKSTDWYTAIAIFTISIADIGGILIGFATHCPEMADRDTGLFRDTNRILLCVCGAGIFAACVGASPPIIFMESIVGLASGARTGLAASVCGILLGMCICLKYTLSLIPECIGFSILILVGSLMMESAISGIEWHDIREAFPAWMTIMGIAYTCSICTGIGFGLCFYVAINLPFWQRGFGNLGFSQSKNGKSSNNLSSLVSTADSDVYYKV